MRYHDQCNLAICLTVSQPVYFTWQCVMRYLKQCLSPDNVSCCTTTNVFHLTMCYAVLQPVYFSWQCSMWYHNQCLSPCNVTYGTMLSAFHMAMCHTLPRPVPFTWQCVVRYHNQCNMTIRHMVPRPVEHDNAPYDNTTSVFHMAKCHTVPRPVSFTWQSVIRYHDQCLSDAQMLKVRLQVLTRYTFQWLGKALWFSPESAFERRHWNLFSKEIQKTKMAICTKRENVIDASRRHLYHAVSV